MSKTYVELADGGLFLPEMVKGVVFEPFVGRGSRTSAKGTGFVWLLIGD